MKKGILLLLIGVDLIRSIARQHRKLVQVLHHRHVSLLEVDELLPLQLHHTVGNVVLSK
jgi:hypothetical protein